MYNISLNLNRKQKLIIYMILNSKTKITFSLKCFVINDKKNNKYINILMIFIRSNFELDDPI